MSTRLTRRQLFRLRIGDLPELARQARDPGDPGSDESVEALFRPPGAISDEDLFLETCERCHACAGACPHGVIAPLPASSGPREGTPAIDPENVPCRWCKDMPCIHACPSGALAFGPAESINPIGVAELDLDTCLTSHGTLCDSCATACPPNVRAIRMVGRHPVLDEEACTGCGMCVQYCESQPISLKIIPLSRP